MAELKDLKIYSWKLKMVYWNIVVTANFDLKYLVYGYVVCFKWVTDWQ